MIPEIAAFLAGIAVGLCIGFVWWRDTQPHVCLDPQMAMNLDLLKQKALGEIKAYMDEREAQYRTIRQRARHRQKRPVR